MSSLPQNSDYLIVGGGTAGLVVACRLSENPNVKVMVLESGPNCTQDPRVQNPDGWHNLSGSELDWKLKIIPQVCSPPLTGSQVKTEESDPGGPQLSRTKSSGWEGTGRILSNQRTGIRSSITG